jgi:sporulation protein YlmC with PRC-barrel domain
MKQHLLAAAAVIALAATPFAGAMAQTSGTTPPANQQEAPAGTMPGAETPQDQPAQTPESTMPQTEPPTVDSPTADTMEGASDNPLMQMTAGDLIGKSVVNQEGDEVGEIEDIVIGTNDKAVQAIVSVGGFLGIGDKNVAVAFDELQQQDEDSVLLSSGATVEELKQRPAYDEASGDYETLPRDRTPADTGL